MSLLTRFDFWGSPGPARDATYRIIFEAETRLGKLFDIVLILAILSSVTVVMLDSVPEIAERYHGALRIAEWFFTGLFTIEYLARIWCVASKKKYALSFFGIIDLLSVIPTYLSLLIPGIEVLADVRILRVVRVFRILKLVQYMGEAEVLMATLKASRFKMAVFLITVMSIVVVIGSIIYLIEGPENGFTSIPRGLYWSVVTLTTVGYGDVTPQTGLGQALAAILMVLGYALIAVPTGLFSAEFVQQSRAPKIHSSAPAQSCPGCGTLETDQQADYCRYCGQKLI
ncbi:MAG: ion transporter [Gemmatimonadota bacterium]|nr:ion transporter [Gemmatimonadota bacterium]